MGNKIIIGCLLLGASSAKAQNTRLSTVEYKERALEYNRQIKQGPEERIAMQHTIEATKTSLFPPVDFSGSYQYRTSKYNLDFESGMSVEMDHNTCSLSTMVSQPTYTGGQIYSDHETAQVQSKTTEQAEELTTNNIVYPADLSCWMAATRKSMYDVMCQYVDVVGELANVLMIRFNDGQVSKTDLLQVKSYLKRVKLDRSSAYKEYQIALQDLNSLTGVSPLDPIEVEGSIMTYPVLPLQVEEDVALRNRPSYTISGLNIEYQKRQTNLSRAKYDPSLAIGFQGTWDTPILNVKGPDQLWTPAVFTSLKVSSFRWGTCFKEANSQKAILHSKEYTLDDAHDKIAQEIANVWTSLTEYVKQITTAEEVCRTIEENLDLSTFNYNEGRLPILDVLSAQLSWTQSYSNLTQTWYQQKVSSAQYNKTIGIRRLR